VGPRSFIRERPEVTCRHSCTSLNLSLDTEGDAPCDHLGLRGGMAYGALRCRCPRFSLEQTGHTSRFSPVMTVLSRRGLFGEGYFVSEGVPK
jgi:hypothetical protein